MAFGHFKPRKHGLLAGIGAGYLNAASSCPLTRFPEKSLKAKRGMGSASTNARASELAVPPHTFIALFYFASECSPRQAR